MFKKLNRYKIWGIILILIVCLWNVFIMEFVYGFDDVTQNIFDIVTIYVFDVVLSLAAFFLVFYEKLFVNFLKRFLPNLLIFCFVFVLCIFLFELFLKAGVLHPDKDDKFIWTPAEWENLNMGINQRNAEFAKQNEFGFNDKNRSLAKPEGIKKRIAVLGDSFIWGDGVEYDTIWSHKLEKKVTEKYPDVEVISWGKNGWSTLDEFNFLKEHGADFNIDLLIIGFVVNDPDLGDFKVDSAVDKSFVLQVAKKMTPNTFQFIRGHMDAFLIRYFSLDYGYLNWEDKLYSEENLNKYKSLLEELSGYLDFNNIPALVVFTPNTPHPYFREQYDKVIPLLEETNLSYLDLYPVISEELAGYKYRELWANPGNSHPNDIVTDIYAKEVFAYLKENYYSLFVSD